MIEKQQDQEKAISYLVSKGYVLRLWVTDAINAPKELHPYINHKKICLFTLFDPKGKEQVDQFVTEYSAVPSVFERTLRSMVRYK